MFLIAHIVHTPIVHKVPCISSEDEVAILHIIAYCNSIRLEANLHNKIQNVDQLGLHPYFKLLHRTFLFVL